MARGKKFNGQDRKPWHSDAGGSEAQRRFLQRGVSQPGGKLPLFDEDGQEIPKVTIRACLQTHASQLSDACKAASVGQKGGKVGREADVRKAEGSSTQ